MIFLIQLFIRFQVLQGEKTFVRNKMAQIFALTFVVDYPLKVRSVVSLTKLLTEFKVCIRILGNDYNLKLTSYVAVI